MAITGIAVIAATKYSEPFIKNLPEFYSDYASFLIWLGVIFVCVFCW